MRRTRPSTAASTSACAMFSSSCATAAGYSCSQWDSNWSNTCNYDFFLMYSDNNGVDLVLPGQRHRR